MFLSLALLLKAVLTGLAGALGTGARHSISIHSRRTFGDHFPWGTLAINVIGALLIGTIAAFLTHHNDLGAWRNPLILGFLGGFTTFSTFMLEVARLRLRGAHHLVWTYILVTLILGPVAAFAGLALGRFI